MFEIPQTRRIPSQNRPKSPLAGRSGAASVDIRGYPRISMDTHGFAVPTPPEDGVRTF
jgi:hypothetical protein